MWNWRKPYVIGRKDNVVIVDFTRRPEPPAPGFPGAGALREISAEESKPEFWSMPLSFVAGA